MDFFFPGVGVPLVFSVTLQIELNKSEFSMGRGQDHNIQWLWINCFTNVVSLLKTDWGDPFVQTTLDGGQAAGSCTNHCDPLL